MAKNIFQRLRFLYRIQQDNLSFEEIVDFLYGEKPPADGNYLAYDYSSNIQKIVKFNEARDPSEILFSVIIPTYNRPQYLSEMLATLGKQENISKNSFEIIVVDNSPKDTTEEIVMHFVSGGAKLNLIYIKLLKNYGGDFARNIGVLNSHGDLLVFTDDDCMVPGMWLANFQRELKKNPALAGTGGWKEPHAPDGKLDIYHRFLFWTHRFYPTEPQKGRYFVRSGYTANACYRRAAFEKVGGFNIYFRRVGFHDLAVRMFKRGMSIGYEPHNIVHHYANFSFSDFYRKCFFLGWSYYLLYTRYPDFWKNITFYSSLKRATRYSYTFLYDKKDPIFPKKTASTVIRFVVLSVVSGFCLWFGKYWSVYHLNLVAIPET